jgi:hypothetical protein
MAGAFKQYRVRHGMSISRGNAGIAAVSVDIYWNISENPECQSSNG